MTDPKLMPDTENFGEKFEVLVIGAGPAGIAAACAASESGARVGIVDDNPGRRRTNLARRRGTSAFRRSKRVACAIGSRERILYIWRESGGAGIGGHAGC